MIHLFVSVEPHLNSALVLTVFFLNILLVIACTEIHYVQIWSVAICFVHCGTIKANPAYTQAHVCTLPCMHKHYLDTSDNGTHHLPL